MELIKFFIWMTTGVVIGRFAHWICIKENWGNYQNLTANISAREKRQEGINNAPVWEERDDLILQ